MGQKETLLERSQADYQDFSKAALSLTRKELEMPGLIEERAFRDVIAHIAAWQLIAAAAIIEMRSGIKSEIDYRQDTVIDAYNATIMKSFEKFPTENLLGLLANAQRVMVAIIETLSDDELAEGEMAQQWLQAETFEHYQEHLPNLKNYLASKGR